ncbi:hypothetical protein ACFLYR_02670 [Chloroflexota bacterium]
MHDRYKKADYMVVFLDVLGQSRKLEKLKRLPITQAEIEKADQILDRTAGSIVKLRKGFDSLFNALSKPTGILDSLPPEKRSMAMSLRQNKITRRGISDSYIMTLPLVEDELFGQGRIMLNIFSALSATYTIFAAALVEKMAIRGGVEIGLGTPLSISNDEVYGPAVARTVRLENKVAQYPRVVVGEHLWQYLCEVEGLPCNTKLGLLTKKYAVESKNLICREYDGVHVLDYLGEGVRSLKDGLDPLLVKKAYQWVTQEHDKYIKSKNYELAGRFGLLRQYMESRLPLWDLTPKRWIS